MPNNKRRSATVVGGQDAPATAGSATPPAVRCDSSRVKGQDLQCVPSVAGLSFYAKCDDYDLCRRIQIPWLRVQQGRAPHSRRHTSESVAFSLKDLRRKIHDTFSRTYELAFAAEDIRVYGSGGAEDAREVRTDKQLARALGYNGPHRSLQGACSNGSVVLIASRHIDDTLRHVLVVPAVWPVPRDGMLAAMEPRPRRCTRQGARLLLGAGGSDLARRVCNLLVDAPPDLISHIPFPVHIDDWQAQYREDPQPVSDVRRAPLTERRTIYVQPIRANLAGSTPVSQRALGMQAGARHHGQVEAAGDMSTDLLDDMRQYIEAYYDNACPVKVLPPLTVNVDVHKKPRKTVTSAKVWRGRVAPWCTGDKHDVGDAGKKRSGEPVAPPKRSTQSASFVYWRTVEGAPAKR
eukprot:INCI7250.3.p1 GENE.INCI7250.3~~INCI7250.3.p1  ORF type:complete len:406 (-),score=43.89 INCI7250.3:822-2039(-)